MYRNFVILAAVFGFLGVGAGAFGSHALRGVFEARPNDQSTYETAVEFQLIHAVALLGAAAAASAYPNAWTRRAGWLFALGIVLFCGSLYLLSVLNLRFMGAVAPFGGGAFVAGWAYLGIGAWRAKP